MTSHMQPAGPRRTTGSPPPAVTWFVRLAEMGDAFGMQELLAADRTIVSLPDAEGTCAIHGAAREGHADAVAVLLSVGADVLVLDKAGRTALMLAALGGHVAVCELLLHAGCSVEQRSTLTGDTALLYAARGGHLDAVRLFAVADSDLDCVNIDGMSPIMYAARDDRHDLVQLLANLGASPHQRNAADQQNAPLMYAAMNGCMSSAAALVELGVDLEARNAANFDAIRLAELAQHDDVAAMLKQAIRRRHLGLKLLPAAMAPTAVAARKFAKGAPSASKAVAAPGEQQRKRRKTKRLRKPTGAPTALRAAAARGTSEGARVAGNPARAPPTVKSAAGSQSTVESPLAASREPTAVPVAPARTAYGRPPLASAARETSAAQALAPAGPESASVVDAAQWLGRLDPEAMARRARYAAAAMRRA